LAGWQPEQDAAPAGGSEAATAENEVNENMIAADVRKSFIRASLSSHSLCRGFGVSNRPSYLLF
jgi:hypothetical protein